MADKQPTPWLMGWCPRCDAHLQPQEDSRLNLWKVCQLCGWEALFRPNSASAEREPREKRRMTGARQQRE